MYRGPPILSTGKNQTITRQHRTLHAKTERNKVAERYTQNCIIISGFLQKKMVDICSDTCGCLKRMRYSL